LGLVFGALTAAVSASAFSTGGQTIETAAEEWETYLFHDAALDFAGLGDAPMTSAIELLDDAGFDAGELATDLLASGVPGQMFTMAADMAGELDEAQIKERRCLAQAIYYEARNQPVMGRFAVADVVLNRVDDRRFPSSICGVVFQGVGKSYACQFSFACDGSMDRPMEPTAWEKAQKLADIVYRGFRPPVTGLATFYHANYVDPYWASSFDETTVIGDHIFYRPGDAVRLAAAKLGVNAQEFAS
jgi:hypothetical protein